MTTLRVAARVPHTRAEGPSLRFAVWVQGCTLACPGCCNPEMFNATGGESILVHDLLAEVGNVEGITILGGEPLQQLPAVAELAGAASRRGLGVIVFTGYTLEHAGALPGFDRLWSSIDTLVDGPFDARSPEPADGRRVIGSSNQRLRHRTDRYRDPALWGGPKEVEIHVDGGGVIEFVGSPQPAAALLRELRRSGRAGDR